LGRILDKEDDLKRYKLDLRRKQEERIRNAGNVMENNNKKGVKKRTGTRASARKGSTRWKQHKVEVVARGLDVVKRSRKGGGFHATALELQQV